MSYVRLIHRGDIYDVYCNFCDRSWIFSIDQHAKAQAFLDAHHSVDVGPEYGPVTLGGQS